MNPTVAVVILNWNGKDHLERFLPSVVKSKYTRLKIVVGDNASTDGSVEFVQTNYPQIDVIVNERNYGFAEGYNKVLQHVSADYYVLLNSDVEVPPKWIKPVIDLMQNDDLIAVAQPKIRSYVNRHNFEYAGAAGGFIDKYGYPFCRGRIFETVEPDTKQYDQDSEIFWASGAAFFIKSKYWKEAEGLDADLFAHMEEIDLCWRLKNKGLKVMYCAGSEVFHLGGGTLAPTSPHKTYLNFRNNLIIMQKNLPAGAATKLVTVRFFLDLVAWVRFLFGGKAKFSMAISKAHFHFLQNARKTARKKREKPRNLEMHTGVYLNSIVYSYFLKKIKKFSLLPVNKIRLG